MRKLIVFMHMSLDGYVSAADKNLSLSLASESDLFSSVVPQIIKGADTPLLGRVLSDELLGYWLNAEATNPKLSEGERAYARWATAARKVILSKKRREIDLAEHGSAGGEGRPRHEQDDSRTQAVSGRRYTCARRREDGAGSCRISRLRALMRT